MPEVFQLQQEMEVTKIEVKQLQERNQSLSAEVQDLKKGLGAIEERARSELGMIKKGEVYYQVIEPARKKATPSNKQRVNRRTVNRLMINQSMLDKAKTDGNQQQ